MASGTILLYGKTVLLHVDDLRSSKNHVVTNFTNVSNLHRAWHRDAVQLDTPKGCRYSSFKRDVNFRVRVIRREADQFAWLR